MRWSIVNHFFINWIGSLVRENASRQARNNLLNFGFVSVVNDIVIDQEIVSEKFGLLTHVLEQSSDTSSQVKNVSWLMALKNCLGLFKGSKGKLMTNFQIYSVFTSSHHPLKSGISKFRLDAFQILDHLHFQLPNEQLHRPIQIHQ